MKFDDKKFLAKQIKTYRKKANLTQEDLAERVELSTQHISRIEAGCYTPSLKSFFAIVNELNLDLKNFGFDIKNTSNPIKDQLIQNIIEANDEELIFYENVINAIKSSFARNNEK
ncbi:MAG: helix-turn-helix transcriptional regulator [Cyanobacteria bacterium SIG28]|nr:helix-turn-helix transcriptional regulator [Cyanobacteria bacterium SIG28]